MRIKHTITKYRSLLLIPALIMLLACIPGVFSIINTNNLQANGTFQINWEASEAATGYELKIGSDHNCTNLVVPTQNLPATQTSYQVTGLSDQIIYVCLRALGPDNSSTKAKNSPYRIVIGPLPQPPQAFSFIERDLSQGGNLEWTESVNADYYRLKYSENLNTSCQNAQNLLSKTRSRILPISPNKDMRFCVYAINESGETPATNNPFDVILNPDPCAGHSDPFTPCNADFEFGDLTNWTVAEGTAEVVVDNTYVGKMVSAANNQASITIPINTPNEGFYLKFKARLLVTSGKLDATVNGVKVLTIPAPQVADTLLKPYTVYVADTGLRNLTGAEVKLTHKQSTSGAGVHLANVDDLEVVPKSEFQECFYEGDAIGTSATTGVGGNGMHTALGNSKAYWEAFYNAGNPAILFHSDGTNTLSEFRAILAVGWPGQPTRDFHYPCSLWTLDIWKLENYSGSTPPDMTVNLGTLGDNMPGFKTIANGSVVPDAAVFATSGGTNNFSGYEFIWNLARPFHETWTHTQAPILDPWYHGTETFNPFATPLPAGSYVIGIQGRGDIHNCGYSTIFRDLQATTGPQSYMSCHTCTPIKAPGPVYPSPWNNNPNYKWAISMKVAGPYCEN